METNEYAAELSDDLRKENEVQDMNDEDFTLFAAEEDYKEEVQEKVADLMEQGIF